MKLSKIYSNLEEKFKPIFFNEGYNVIIGKVKEPKNMKKNSHNLGKTLLIHLIDFLLLKTLKKEHFLKKHFEIFKDFVFLLEIQLNSGKYITIRRSVKNNTRISIKLHDEKHQDFRYTDEHLWDYQDLPFSNAKEKLNELFNLSSISPFNYRDGISYFLRTQADFNDVFQLSKVSRSKHEYWKPYLVKILGFDHELVEKKYEYDNKIEDKKKDILFIKNESDVSDETEKYDKIKGFIEVKESDLHDKKSQIDKFNFYTKELNLNKRLIEDIETNIAYYNKILYTNNYEIEKVKQSLEPKIDFNIEKAKALFDEVNIYFPDQLVKSYKQLELFNKQLYSERENHLKETLSKLEEERKKICDELQKKNCEREELLSLLEDKDTFRKFKAYQQEIVQLEKDIVQLKMKLDSLDKIGSQEKELDEIKLKQKQIINNLEEHINKGNELYRSIRNTFAEITNKILDKSAIVYVEPNEKGNIKFYDSFVTNTMDETSEGRGFTYKKILCEIFDLTILKNYYNKNFYKFVYQDGAFESLDDRIKINLLNLIREFCDNYNLQYILTLIEDDLPRIDGNKIEFKKEEIIRELDDTGIHGRLFNMDEF